MAYVIENSRGKVGFRHGVIGVLALLYGDALGSAFHHVAAWLTWQSGGRGSGLHISVPYGPDQEPVSRMRVNSSSSYFFEELGRLFHTSPQQTSFNSMLQIGLPAHSGGQGNSMHWLT